MIVNTQPATACLGFAMDYWRWRLYSVCIIYMCVRMCTYIYTYTIPVCVYVCSNVCLYVCIYMCMCMCMCVYICVCVCVCVYIYIYIYICMYVYLWILVICLHCRLWVWFVPCSGVSVVELGQVIAGWVLVILMTRFLLTNDFFNWFIYFVIIFCNIRLFFTVNILILTII